MNSSKDITLAISYGKSYRKLGPITEINESGAGGYRSIDIKFLYFPRRVGNDAIQHFYDSAKLCRLRLLGKRKTVPLNGFIVATELAGQPYEAWQCGITLRPTDKQSKPLLVRKHNRVALADQGK